MKSYLIIGVCLSSAALAQTTATLGEIQVFEHAGEQSLVDFVPSVTTLKGRELLRKRQNTIGDTLQNEAGVSSTSFGPNAGRPVIRGLDGMHIRFLQNSLGVLDASTQSVDHAIPIDPLLIDQIEIVRGPMGLLYGSSAVGGIVNIVTNRTHSEFHEGLTTELQTQGESVNDGLSHSLRMDYGKDKWMFHLDGSLKNLQDQKIPGYARTEKLRREGPVDDEPKNKLPNSFNDQANIGAGATKFFDRGHVGLSFGHFKNEYGIVAEEGVTIDMLQNRFELLGEYRPQDFIFDTIKIKSAQSDYQHKEFEEGVTGTIFTNEGNETRIEGVNKGDNINGVTGIQTQIFNFKAVGEEAFLPGTKNQIVSLFTFQEYKKGSDAYSAGLRLEQTIIKKDSSEAFPGTDEFGFTGLNGALGYLHNFDKYNTLSTSYSYTERAPNFQELLSDGEHVATSSIEVGNPNLKKEKSHSLEVSFKNRTDESEMTASVFAQKFDNYIALSPVANEPGDELDRYNYNHRNAVFYGFDLDGKQLVHKSSKGVWNVFEKFDFVIARDISNDEFLPRITPPRATTGLEYLTDKSAHDITFQYIFEQHRTAPNEDHTDGYFMTHLGTQYTLIKDATKLDLFFRVRNLFNEEARPHVSFIKDRYLLPGRNFILGAQLLF